MRARDLLEDEQAVVEAVAHWDDREVRPHAGQLERAQEYPAALIGQMKEMGVFGLAVPERWSDSAVSTRCFALVTEELARGG
jgi:alkylation response protein AidB-like acyl-CoA dehydrogenase